MNERLGWRAANPDFDALRAVYTGRVVFSERAVLDVVRMLGSLESTVLRLMAPQDESTIEATASVLALPPFALLDEVPVVELTAADIP